IPSCDRSRRASSSTAGLSSQLWDRKTWYLKPPIVACAPQPRRRGSTAPPDPPRTPPLGHLHRPAGHERLKGHEADFPRRTLSWVSLSPQQLRLSPRKTACNTAARTSFL